ncbi:glycoside hydrolase family 9 protein [Flexithrix dorotheae]|uniref:glycoside hydrolase family 9 protein n=1 Tax=Flexithrix dorotheae TaxID=70993 RepID=UPI000371F14A|nr:glycoside hydrolase family 9 protein [Flexithrix dorotheae]
MVKSKSNYRYPIATLLITAVLFLTVDSFGQKLKINDQDYFETAGVNVLVFSSEYNGMFFDEKTAGIEIIHHGVRTSTGGAVRLQNTPEQWDLVPKIIDRKVDKENNSIEVTLRYEEFDFDSKVVVKAKGNGVAISVILDKEVPEKLKGLAGFNMEFIPSAYFEKNYLIDGKPGTFPLYPAGNTNMEPISKKIHQYEGHSTFDDRGRGEWISPHPLETGKTIVLAPEDPENYIKIESETEDLMLFDGRNLAQNGWFIVRSILPTNKTGNVLNWYVEPNSVDNWFREPVIGFSQVGYHPERQKVAVIELDKNAQPLQSASLFMVDESGAVKEVLKNKVIEWGKFYRYNYVKFDFSSVKDEGVYFIKYGNHKTNSFPIGANVYENIGNPTLDVFFPVQMDHMKVNEGYRTWHGEPFMDDALQAPLNLNFFDGYRMSDTTDTKYKPLEHIPGLAVGGWFDAGDFDIQTGTHNRVVTTLTDIWEHFNHDRDQTYIDQETRYVDIHRPDGKPDVLQQLEHGTLNLVAQIKNIGHPVRGIIVPNLHQYHHLGDASTETDNLRYNSNLNPYESDGLTSGTMDDRWAFTNRSPMLDFSTAGALAAAYRSLKNYNKPLADESLMYAKTLYKEATEMQNEMNDNRMRRWAEMSRISAALQLFITTQEDKYKERFAEDIWPALESMPAWTLSMAIQAYPHMDTGYQAKLKDFIVAYKESIEKLKEENPYGVPITTRGWAGNNSVISWATTNYYAYKAFPDIIEPEDVYRGLDYILGCHPYHNLSFVSAVGVKSKKVAYGSNRADFAYIAGGIVPGILVLKPDFPENKEDWPFFWGENEYIVDIGADFILLSLAINELISKE